MQLPLLLLGKPWLEKQFLHCPWIFVNVLYIFAIVNSIAMQCVSQSPWGSTHAGISEPICNYWWQSPVKAPSFENIVVEHIRSWRPECNIENFRRPKSGKKWPFQLWWILQSLWHNFRGSMLLPLYCNFHEKRLFLIIEPTAICQKLRDKGLI